MLQSDKLILGCREPGQAANIPYPDRMMALDLLEACSFRVDCLSSTSNDRTIELDQTFQSAKKQLATSIKITRKFRFSI